MTSVEERSAHPFDRIRNTSLRNSGEDAPPAAAVPDEVADAIEALVDLTPPRVAHAFGLNFDHSDLTPLMVSLGGTEEPSPVGLQA